MENKNISKEGQNLLGQNQQGKNGTTNILYYVYSVHCEFTPEGQTVNTKLTVKILRRLRDATRRKHPEKWAENN